jgi:hypothetical protein
MILILLRMNMIKIFVALISFLSSSLCAPAIPPDAVLDPAVEPADRVQAIGLGKLRIALPESALEGLAGIRIVRRISDKIVKEGPLSSADSMHPLMSGDYSLALLFANPNNRPPTEMPVGDFAVIKGETTEIRLGALGFHFSEELKKAPVEALIVRESGTGREALRILPHGIDADLFEPKALPPGTYDVALLYRRSETPAILATRLEVAPGKESVLTLDSGFSLVRPARTKVAGWELRPVGGSEPTLAIQRGLDNEEPLWRPFPVPPGLYDLRMRVDGMDEARPVGEGISIEAGQTLRFDTGL